MNLFATGVALKVDSRPAGVCDVIFTLHSLHIINGTKNIYTLNLLYNYHNETFVIHFSRCHKTQHIITINNNKYKI